MTDEAPKLTKDAVVRYLESRGVITECPSCHNPRWSAPPVTEAGELLEIDLARLPRSIGEVGPRQSLQVIALTCQNCGYIRQHASASIRGWLKEQSSEWSEQEARDGSAST